MICVSNDERRIAIAKKLITPSGIRVIHNAIDLSLADRQRQSDQSFKTELGYAPDDFIVGCVADLRPQKGLDYLIRAAKSVLEVHPRVKFLVVGSGYMIQKLNKLLSTYALQERFQFVPARNSIWKHYAIMDLFVLPSLWEGLPYAVLEAMAMSKAVVATAVAGTREVVVPNETGLLVPPANEQALAQAIVMLIERPELRDRMGMNGRRRVETDFRIESKVKELEVVYQYLRTKK